MRVVHLNITEKYGGAAKAAYRLHKELIKQGIDSKMLVLKKETNDPDVIKTSSLYSVIDKGKLFFRKALNKFHKVLRNPERRYDNRTLLFNVLKRLDVDIIHLHWVTDGYVNLKEFIDDSRSIIWTMHDCAAFTGICHVVGNCENFMTGCGKCPLISSSEEKDISSAEFLRKSGLYKKRKIHFVSPSNWLASVASRSPLLEEKKITVIPHGIDTEKYTPIDKTFAKKALLIEDNIKIILCGAVTFNDENKGMLSLIEALKHFRENLAFEDKIELLFFGERAEDNDVFGIKANYLGYLNDEEFLRICYSAADVVVIPSKQESFGLIVLEAMACGTPVVAFGATGPLDIVDHKETGYLARPYDTTDLAEGIKWCLENNLDSGLSVKARARVLSSFRIESTAQKYHDLYKNVIADK